MPWKVGKIVDQRAEFCFRALTKDVSFKGLCHEYGIKPKTGYKWVNRFKEGGIEGLHDRSRRPKSSPTMLSEDVICDIVILKESHKKWGPKKIREVYRRKYRDRPLPCLSSFKRVLEKCGLVERRRKRRSRESGRLQNRVEAKSPNDVWTVDFKGWWYTPERERCEPLSVRDDFSRYVLGLSVPASARTEPVRKEFERWFEEYGLPRIIRSDNGAPFASRAGPLGLTRFSAWLISLGIDLDRIRPGCPFENGRHERMHLDISLELEGHIQGGLKEHEASLDVWRREYNEERPHESLGMKVPADVYKPSPRRFEGTPDRIAYPKGYLDRLVSKQGRIRVLGKSIWVSRVFRGWNLGLQPMGDGEFSVYFGRLCIGQLEMRSESFQAVCGRLARRSG